MLINNFNKIDEDFFSTVLESDFAFSGTLKTDDSLLIKGLIHGDIETDNVIVIGPEAIINANITAKSLQCFGTIKGDVKVMDEVYFHDNSKVTGDVCTPAVSIEKGCVINGKIKMINKE